MRDAREQILHEIHDERCRQIVREGYTPEHDDQHSGGDLACAAIAYAQSSVADYIGLSGDELLVYWPWEREAFKPKDSRRDLVRAAALILAEIERLDRAAVHSVETSGGTP